MVLITQLRQTFFKISGKKFDINMLAASYDQIGHQYLSFYEPFQEEYIQLGKSLGSLQGKKILDLGCGPGWFGKLILENSLPELYQGVDISTEMIHQGRKLLKDFPNKKFIHNDFLPFLQQAPENYWDVILCTWSLEFNAVNTLFKEILRVLKPGGKLVMLIDLKNSCSPINDILHELVNRKLNQIDFLLPKKYLPNDYHELTELFNKNGFRQTIIRNKSQELIFDSPSQLYSWAKNSGLFAVYDQILDLKDNNSNELIKALASSLPGKQKITKKYLSVIAIK